MKKEQRRNGNMIEFKETQKVEYYYQYVGTNPNWDPIVEGHNAWSYKPAPQDRLYPLCCETLHCSGKNLEQTIQTLFADKLVYDSSEDRRAKRNGRSVKIYKRITTVTFSEV